MSPCLDSNYNIISQYYSILPFALRSFGRSSYHALHDDDGSKETSTTGSGSTHTAETQVDDDRAANTHKRPITLEDLLTPSEKGLAREQLFLPEKTQNNQEGGRKAKFISHLKFKKKKDSSHRSERHPGPDAHQVQKAFKLTSHQLRCVSPTFSRSNLSFPIPDRIQNIRCYMFLCEHL